MREAIEMMGVPVHPWTMQETVAEIARRLDEGVFTQHVVINVAKVVNMRRDTGLREGVLACDIINVDGMGVVWGGRLLGLDIPERVAGIDLFFDLLALAERRQEPVFFLGARPEVVEQAVGNLQGSYPHMRIVGWHHGYFWDNEQAVVEKIRRSGATLLFVAISSPKKEIFIARWREQLGVKFAMGIGGTLDIVAEKTKRAPLWMQKVGCEWLYRVLQEPRRMWKRYLITNSKFMWMLIKEKMRSLTKRGQICCF